MSHPSEASERLSETEAMYRRLVERQPDLICRFLSDSTLTFVNEAYARFFGQRAEDLLGRKWLDFVPSEQREAVRQQLGSFSPEAPARQYEHSTPGFDGALRWHLWHDYAFFDEQGHLTGIQSVGVDITDRKRAEARMERMVSVFLSMDDDLASNAGKITDLCGELLGAGCAFYNRKEKDDLFSLGSWHAPEGYVPRRSPSSQICGELLMQGESATKVIENLAASPHAERNPDVRRFGFETYVGHAVFCRGETVGVLCAFFPEPVKLSVEDRQMVSLLAFALGVQEERDRDRRQQQRLQAELANVQKMESVSRLAGGVAHDFNNQLTVIMGLAQMMQGRMPSSDLVEDVADILEAARHAATLTRRLLGFAQKQSGSPIVLDLNHVVKGLLPMLRQLTGDVDLLWRPAAQIGSVFLDASQLDQVLASLLTNAREATETCGGRIEVETANDVCSPEECTCHSESAPGEYVRLSVIDTGRGIPAEHLDKIFEPFFTTKPAGTSAGLGLAMVYGIVKQNRGCVRVRSEPGKGTSVDLYFPRHARAPEAPLTPPPRRAPGGRGERILVVEDESAVLNLARRMLQKAGYEVLTAGTPAEALRVVDQHGGAIDLLLTDVVMPEMNGSELVERLHARYPALKCALMSGFSADVIGERGLMQKNVPFLRKPFSVEALTSTVRDVLDRA